MTGVTLLVDIDRAGPGRCGLAAVAADVGTGAAAAIGRAALSVEAGRDSDFGGAVMDGTIMAGSTDWSHRTETQYGVFGMGPFGVWWCGP